MAAVGPSSAASKPTTTTSTPSLLELEQFVLLAKGTKGAGAAELVKQALDSPGLYVFSELMDCPSIQEVRNIIIQFIFFSF